MKLLFDQNLSPHLVPHLADLFPGSTHVHEVNLDIASDADVWAYALKNGFTVISKDADFSDLSELRGYPPKVIWIRKENCSTAAIEETLRNDLVDIQRFTEDPDRGVLILL